MAQNVITTEVGVQPYPNIQTVTRIENEETGRYAIYEYSGHRSGYDCYEPSGAWRFRTGQSNARGFCQSPAYTD